MPSKSVYVPTSPTTAPVVSLRFAFAVQDVDFRFGFQAQVRQVAKQYADRINSLHDDDCVLLVSCSNTRGLFIPGVVLKQDPSRIHAGSIWALSFACPDGFSWFWIGDYALSLGIELNNVKLFAEHLAAIASGVEKSLSLNLRTASKKLKEQLRTPKKLNNKPRHRRLTAPRFSRKLAKHTTRKAVRS